MNREEISVQTSGRPHGYERNTKTSEEEQEARSGQKVGAQSTTDGSEGFEGDLLDLYPVDLPVGPAARPGD